MRLENGGEAKPTGLVISTAVPFAPGAVRDVAEIGLDAPGEVEPLETHRDGSVRWARVRVRPVWKGLRATFVELRRGGKRPELPTEAFGEPPPLSLVLEGQDGVERRAEIAPAQWRSIERSELREVLRASARHIATKATGGTALPPALFACELFLERFRGAPFVFATVVLRNDPPSDPVGAMRFRSYRLEVPAPWKTAVAWPQQNGVAIEAHSSGASVTWLLPRETADLWLGDGQTKAWRCLLDPSGDEARFRSLARVLEHPFLPGLKPAELVRSRAWGDLGDVVLGPPPEAASSLAQAEFARVHGTAGRPGEREYGWASAWGDVKDTHQTGSPRNGLCSDGVVRTLQTGFREWFDLAYERATQQALRPILRGLRAADHPQAMLYEGMPHPSWPDRLGRERDPDPNLGRFREGTAGGWLQETHGWNGFDEQHFTVDDLYAIHLLTGDPWVRFELESIGQALLTYRFAREGVSTGSSRGDGWLLRGLTQLARATRDPAYVDAAKRLLSGMDADRSKGPMKWLHSNPPDPRQLVNHAFEMPWQVGIAINGLAAFHELTGDELARKIALDAAEFLVKDGWNPKASTFRRCIATDGSGASIDETDRDGTQLWIASALVAAHRLEAQPEFAILAEGLYRKAGNAATFERGGMQWTWWQSFLRWQNDRLKK